MQEDIVQEPESEMSDHDISEYDLSDQKPGSSYSLHLARGISFCSSISAESDFESLFDEVIEEWIDDDGNVYLVEEYSTTEFQDNDHAVSPCGQSSLCEDMQDVDIVSLMHQDQEQFSSELGPEHNKLEKESQGKRNKSRDTKKKDEIKKKDGSKKSSKKKHSRASFLSTLSRLRPLRKPKRFTNAAA